MLAAGLAKTAEACLATWTGLLWNLAVDRLLAGRREQENPAARLVSSGANPRIIEPGHGRGGEWAAAAKSACRKQNRRTGSEGCDEPFLRSNSCLLAAPASPAA